MGKVEHGEICHLLYMHFILNEREISNQTREALLKYFERDTS